MQSPHQTPGSTRSLFETATQADASESSVTPDVDTTMAITDADETVEHNLMIDAVSGMNAASRLPQLIQAQTQNSQSLIDSTITVVSRRPHPLQVQTLQPQSLYATSLSPCSAKSCGSAMSLTSPLVLTPYAQRRGGQRVQQLLLQASTEHEWDDGAGVLGDHTGSPGERTGVLGDHTGRLHDEHSDLLHDRAGVPRDHTGRPDDMTGVLDDHIGLSDDHSDLHEDHHDPIIQASIDGLHHERSVSSTTNSSGASAGGPLRLLTRECAVRRSNRNEEKTLSFSAMLSEAVPIPEVVAELVVCEGFLDIASVCASARVSTRWKALAYRPSSFGCDLDFSQFGHRLTASVFDSLIKTTRIRIAKRNKRLQTVNLWNCCGVSFRKSAELVSLCSELKELRIIHNKQRSCPHCVSEPHTTFFRDFSFLMNRCENLWVRSSTEIFWLGRAEHFSSCTVLDVQQWFADYLSVECCSDNPCLQRITQMVNEFGRTVSEGRPLQSGLLFMLTSLRNHAFADHGELEVLASDEQWVHENQQIELAYMKFAVRGCTPPSAAVAAHQASHGVPPQQSQQQLEQDDAYDEEPLPGTMPYQPNGYPDDHQAAGVHGAQAPAQGHDSEHPSQAQLSANALALMHAHAAQTQQQPHNQATSSLSSAQQMHAHAPPAQTEVEYVQHPSTSVHQFSTSSHTLQMQNTHSQAPGSSSHVHTINLTASLPQAPAIEVQIGVQPAGTHAAQTLANQQPNIMPHPGPGHVHHHHAHQQTDESPRPCMAPNHVLFIGAPYRWPQPRALPRTAPVDSFSSTGRAAAS